VSSSSARYKGLEPILALVYLDPDSLPPDHFADVVSAAANAASGLFRGGDLERALAVWNLVIAATKRRGASASLQDRRLTNCVWGRAKTLDHLDELEGALAGYEEWRALLEASGRTRMLRWANDSIARMRRKIARRDAGLSYPTHRRGPRPEALRWEADRFRQLLARLPVRWQERDEREAERAAKAAERAAAEADEAAWRAVADPAVVAEYDAVQAEMRRLSPFLTSIRYGDVSDGSGGLAFELALELNPEIAARLRELERRAGELRNSQR
jgi:hypothetical protein